MKSIPNIGHFGKTLPAYFFLIITLVSCTLNPKENTDVLQSDEPIISIYDHDLDRTYTWTFSQETRPNVYTTNKISGAKSISLLSDTDTLAYIMEAGDTVNFLLITAQNDTLLAQVNSGMPVITATIEKADTIPFILTESNNIIIKCLINQVDTVNLMLHTAAGEVNLTETATERMKSLNNYQNEVGAQSWGGTNDFRYIEDNQLHIGDLNWEEITIYEDKYSGPGSDGKFGLNLFHDKIVELNFDRQLMIIHSSLPPHTDEFEQVEVLFDRNMMFMPATCHVDDNQHTQRFLIHTGYAGSLLLDDDFASKYQLDKKLVTISQQDLKDSFGNIIKTKKAIFPKLTVGVTSFDSIPTSFFVGSIGRNKMSIIGGDLVKRFNIIFDFQRAELYLKRNSIDIDYVR